MTIAVSARSPDRADVLAQLRRLLREAAAMQPEHDGSSEVAGDAAAASLALLPESVPEGREYVVAVTAHVVLNPDDPETLAHATVSVSAYLAGRLRAGPPPDQPINAGEQA